MPNYFWENRKLCEIYHNKKQSCYNPNSKHYKLYGAKGIKLCDDWLKNPKSFERWSLENGFVDGSRLELINKNQNFSPDNCRFVKMAKWKTSKLKNTYYEIKSRCYNEKNNAFKYYGGKGIEVCDEWINDPNSFQEWALSNGYAENLTIDRINSDQNYCPDNCRWITRAENTRRASTKYSLTVDNQTKSLKQWSKIINCNSNYLYNIFKTEGHDTTALFVKIILKNNWPRKTQIKIN